MKKEYFQFPEIREAYRGSLLGSIPEYEGNDIAHAVVTEGGKTLRMSGYPAITKDGIAGKDDMRAQTLLALDYVRMTVERAGGTWDDIIHLLFYFTDREKWWREALPARREYIEQHSRDGQYPCITAVGVAGLMHPDMLIEIEATAVFD